MRGRLARTELEPLQDQEVLVRNLFMSVDPYMRGRMNDAKSYVPPFALDKPLDGGAVGEVIESRAKEFKPGDAVTSNFGWREYFIASPRELHPVSREIQPLSGWAESCGRHFHFGSCRCRRQRRWATCKTAGVSSDRISRFT